MHDGIWRRYRWAAVEALIAGTIGGALVGLLLYLGGNPDYRAYGGWEAFGYGLGTFAVLGLLTAAVAGLGALGMLLLGARDPALSGRQRSARGAFGAVLGVLMGCTVLSMVNTAVSSPAFGPRPLVFLGTMMVGIVPALLTGVLALVVLDRAERRAGSRGLTEGIAASKGADPAGEA